MRLFIEKRKIFKNQFDDLVFLYLKLGRNPSLIFDCGANIGFVSYQFYKRFPNAKIYAFEPNPTVFVNLVKNLEKEKKQIELYQLGIGKENSNTDFFKNNNTGTSSFMEPNIFHTSNYARAYEKIKVPIVSINNFCTENKIDKISILKLDIEGFELNALEGCIDLLQNQSIDFVFTEVNIIPTYKGQPLLEDIISFLRKLNYIPYNFYGNNETVLRESIITNILFMSNKVASEIELKEGANSIYTNS